MHFIIILLKRKEVYEVLKKIKYVCILTQYFYPDVASTGQILTELAEDLAKYGLNVEVITAQPSYEEFKKCPSKEIYKGIYITRVWSTHFPKNNILGKIINMASFTLSSFFKVFFSHHANNEIFLIVTNPPYLPVLGLTFKKFRKRPYISLIHDVYPDLAVKLGYLSPKSIVTRLWDKLDKIVLNNSEKIIVLGENMKKVIENKLKSYPHTKNKLVVIHNWADGNEIFPVPRSSNWFIKKYGLEGKLVVLYSGNLGLSHPLEVLIDVAEALRQKEILFLFVGDGGKKPILEMLVEERKLENVKFLPYQSKENLAYSLSSGDIAIITMEQGIKGLSVPSKLYALMAAGRPIMGLVEKGSEVDVIVRKARCGFIFNPDDTEGIIKKINYLIKHPEVLTTLSGNARKYFELNFNRTLITKRYYEMINSLVNGVIDNYYKK